MTPLEEFAKLLGIESDDLLRRLAKARGPLTITTADNVIIAEIEIRGGRLFVIKPGHGEIKQ